MRTASPKANRTSAASGLLLPALLIVTALTGCQGDLPSAASEEQKELIALSKSIPADRPPDGVASVDAGLDSRRRTVRELVDIFMKNRDWTESLPEKNLAAWRRTHGFQSPPVLLHDKQSDAAFQLIQLGPKAKEAAPAMVEALTNSAFLTHEWALRQKGAVDPLVEAHADSLNRHWAIQVLQAIGSASPVVVPALVQTLHAPRRGPEPDESGYRAAEALRIISLSDTNVLPAVIAKLESDPESPEAKNSIQVLDGIGAGASAAVPLLIRLLEHTNACAEVVSALCTIGSNSAPAVPALLQHYERLRGDDHFAERKWIVITLGRIGPGASQAVPMLNGLISRNQQRLDVARALWRIDPQFAQTAINTAVQELRFWNIDAILLLGEIGPAAKSTVPLLLQKLNAPFNDQTEFNLAWAVWRIDPAQKERVVAVFEKFRTREGRYPCTELPVDAAGALWQIEPERREELKPAVIAMLKEWKETPAARAGWAEMKPLRPALENILADPNLGELRPWAILAIRQINRGRAEYGQR